MSGLDPETTCAGGKCSVRGLCKPCFKALGDSPSNARTVERQKRIIDALFEHTSCYPDCGPHCLHDAAERERVLGQLALGLDPNAQPAEER